MISCITLDVALPGRAHTKHVRFEALSLPHMSRDRETNDGEAKVCMKT